jgi:hypothetical protein
MQILQYSDKIIFLKYLSLGRIHFFLVFLILLLLGVFTRSVFKFEFHAVNHILKTMLLKHIFATSQQQKITSFNK